VSLFTKVILSFLVVVNAGPVAMAQTPLARGKSFNPDISVIGSFLYRNSSRGNDSADDDHNGFFLDEAELQFAADIDAYLRASVLFAVHREDGDWKIEPEEAFVESLSLPIVTLKAGKFKTVLGKYNTIHAHALPFIDNQLISTTLLGEEGFSGEGVSAAAMIPIRWFSELTLQALTPNAHPFNSRSPNATVAVGHFKNLWDLTDDLTLESGLSAGDGKNNVKKNSTIYGGDLTLKWRPSQGGKYSAFVWSTEYLIGKTNLNSDETDNTEGIESHGGYSFIQWQFAQRWWVQARTEYVESLDKTSDIRNIQRRNGALIAFLPTEFSALRLQYDHLDERIAKPEDRVLLQLNISMGTHPAHSY